MTDRIAPAALAPLVVLTAALLIATPRADAAALPTYIALGDSMAFGETDFSHNPSYGDRGYVKPFANYLATLDHDRLPNVVNLGVDAETSSTFFNGGPAGDGTVSGKPAPQLNLNYPDATTTQNSMLLSTIASEKAAGHDISAVTVQLGANDMYVALNTPNFFSMTQAQQGAVLMNTLGTIGANDAKLLSELKAEVPNASLYMMGYHDPYAANPTSPLAQVASPAIAALNSLISTEASLFGGHYVDTSKAIAGHETQDTYITSGNAHPNADGYAAIAGALETAAVPEPGSLAIYGTALAALVLCRSRRARAGRD